MHASLGALAVGAALAVVWRSRIVSSQHLPGGALKGSNVLLVTIDTLRADHVGAYGNRTASTPTLDGLSREGIRFDNTLATVPLTLPSHTSLMTGQFPTVHGVRDNGSFRFDGTRPTLASTLKSAGYKTGAFVGAFVLDARFGLNNGFDHYDDFYSSQRPGATLHIVERTADQVIAPAETWIRASTRPWFAWVHLYDPHEPYAPPEPFRSRFASDLYTGEIAYADEQLGQLLDHLRAAALLDDTLVIVAGDHGEALGDHGERTHGLFAYNATLKVPLIAWHARAIRPAVFSPLTRLVDVMPSVLDLLGVNGPPGLEGRSLRPALSGEATYEEPFSYFEALNANLTRNWAPLTGIVHGGFKLIDLPVPELYDLTADPGEKDNIYAKRPDVRGGLESRLDAITSTAAQPANGAGAVDSETAQRLRSLGYIVAPATTRKTSFGARDDPKRLVELNQALDKAVDLFTAGSADEAARILERLIDERADFTVAYDRLGFVYHEMGRLPDAIATLERAVAAGAVDAGLLTALGDYLQEAGQLERSATVLEGALKMNPNELETYEKLGVTYSRMGRVTDAERMFNRMLEIDPGSATTLNNLGSLYLSRERYPEAIQNLTRAISLDPNLAGAHNGLGVAYARTGHMDQAIEEWKTAVRLNDRQFDTLYNLGMALMQLARYEEALESLKQFASTAPPDRYGADIARVRRMISEIDGKR